MKKQQIIIWVLAVLVGLSAGHFLGKWQMPDNKMSQVVSSDPLPVKEFVKQPPILSKAPELTEPVNEEAESKPASGDTDNEGVNKQMRDSPRLQKAWIKRGADITLKTHAEADAANYRNAFFHRGFKDSAVTCGEVEFLAGKEVLENYQRFIFVGAESTYFESKIPNFDVLWGKLCVQTY